MERLHRQKPPNRVGRPLTEDGRGPYNSTSVINAQIINPLILTTSVSFSGQILQPPPKKISHIIQVKSALKIMTDKPPLSILKTIKIKYFQILSIFLYKDGKKKEMGS